MNKLSLFICLIVMMHYVQSQAPKVQNVWTMNNAVLQISNDKNHRVADVWHAQAKDKQKVVIHDQHKGWNQKWRVVNAKGGKFMLKSTKGNFFLGATKGHDVALQWKPTFLHYDVKNNALMKGKKCLDIWQAKMNRNGQKLVWWKCHHSNNQRFSLVKVDSKSAQKEIAKQVMKKAVKKGSKSSSKKAVKETFAGKPKKVDTKSLKQLPKSVLKMKLKTANNRVKNVAKKLRDAMMHVKLARTQKEGKKEIDRLTDKVKKVGTTLQKVQTYAKKLKNLADDVSSKKKASTKASLVTGTKQITSTNAVSVVEYETVEVVKAVHYVSAEVSKTVVEQESRLMRIQGNMKTTGKELKEAMAKKQQKKVAMLSQRLKAAKRNSMDANAKLKVAKAQEKVAKQAMEQAKEA